MWAMGRVLLFGGAILFVVASFLPWYNQSWGAERAWHGAESLTAAVGAVAALVFGIVRGTRPKLVLGLLEFAGSGVAAILSYVYIDQNSGDIFVRGELIPSGMGTAPYIGLAAGAVMTLGSLLSLFVKAPAGGNGRGAS